MKIMSIVALAAMAVLALGIAALIFWRNREHDLALSAAVPEKSVAVLPFDSLGGGEEVSHFADAVQEQILTNLAQNANLKIVARATVMPYRDSALPIVILGRQLGVAHLVMGSVQRAANRVRVTVQLMDARTGDSVWAETFDRELNDVLAIESELAKTVTDQLGTKLAAR